PITAIPGREATPAAAPAPPQPAPTTQAPPSSPAPAASAAPSAAAPASTRAPAPTQSADVAQAEDEAGHTQLRTGAAVPAASGARLRFDDGQVLVLDSTALVGRNPAARDGED